MRARGAMPPSIIFLTRTYALVHSSYMHNPNPITSLLVAALAWAIDHPLATISQAISAASVALRMSLATASIALFTIGAPADLSGVAAVEAIEAAIAVEEPDALPPPPPERATEPCPPQRPYREILASWAEAERGEVST